MDGKRPAFRGFEASPAWKGDGMPTRRLGRPAWDTSKTATQKKRAKMTKFKKITGIALAGCMALSSLMMTAGAAEVPAQALADSMKLSENAGKTMMVNVVNADISGSYDQQVIEVNIPENATVKEEQQAVTAAATKAAGREIALTKATRAASDPWLGYSISNSETVKIYPNGSTSSKTMCTGHADDSYDVLVVYMKNIDPDIEGINVSVWTTAMNVTYGETFAVYSLNNPVSSSDTCTVMFVNNKLAGKNKFLMALGDTVKVNGSTTGGTGYVTTQLFGQY